MNQSTKSMGFTRKIPRHVECVKRVLKNLLCEFVLPNHLRGFSLAFFASIVRQLSKMQHPVAAGNRKIYRRQKMGFVLIQIAYFFLKLQDVSYFSCFTSINFSKSPKMTKLLDRGDGRAYYFGRRTAEKRLFIE